MGFQKPKFKVDDKVRQISDGREGIVVGVVPDLDDEIARKEGSSVEYPSIHLYDVKFFDDERMDDVREDNLEAI